MLLTKLCSIFFIMFQVNSFEIYEPIKSIAVFGSQGRTGRCVLQRAQQLDKHVVSLVKPKHDIKSTDEHKIYRGDVTSLSDVRRVYEENNIVGTIICLGGNTQDVGTDMLCTGTQNIVNCINTFCTSKKVAIVTSIGAGDTVDDPPLFFKILMKTLLKEAFEDKNNQEALFLGEKGIGKDLDFTIVRPSGLTDESMTQTAIITKGSGTIPRINVAEFLINAVNDAEFPYVKQAVSITSLKNNNGDIFKTKYD